MFAALVLALAPAPAAAQTPQNWAFGFVPTPAQWNAVFAGKQDYLGAPPLLTTGGTMVGKLVTAPSTTARAGLGIPAGVAPTAPVNGDLWTTTAGLFARINGTTVGPLTGGSGGSFAATAPLAVAFPSGVVTYSLNTVTVPFGGTGATTFTANLPVLGNGTGALAQGTRSGNTTSFATTSGALTSGDCVRVDASGNLVDNGAACGANSNTPHTQDFLSPGDFTPGTTTSLTLSSAPTVSDLLTIYFDGVAQASNTWSLSTATVTFAAVIPLRTQVVEAKWSTSSTLAGVGSLTVSPTTITGAVTLSGSNGIDLTPSGQNIDFSGVGLLPVFSAAKYGSSAAALAAATSAGRGIVYVPAPETVSTPLAIPPNITFMCASTGTIIRTTSTSLDLFQLSGSNSKLTDCGAEFSGTPGTKTAGYLINVTGLYNVVDNIYIGPYCFVCINVDAAGDTTISKILMGGNLSTAPSGTGGGIRCGSGSLHLDSLTVFASGDGFPYFYGVKNVACSLDWSNSQVDTVNIGLWVETPNAGNAFNTVNNVYLDFCFIYCVLIQPDAGGVVGYTMLSNMELGALSSIGGSIFIDATAGCPANCGFVLNTNISNVTGFNYMPGSGTGLDITGGIATSVRNVLVGNSTFGDVGSGFATGLHTGAAITSARLSIMGNSFLGTSGSITLGGLLTKSQVMYNLLNGGAIANGGNSTTNVDHNLP